MSKTSLTSLRDELSVLITELETAKADHGGPVFEFVPHFITSARAGLDSIDSGLSDLLAEDGSPDDLDRREATNQLHDYVESFRNTYRAATGKEVKEWMQWDHKGKLIDFFREFFSGVESLEDELVERIDRVCLQKLADAKSTFTAWAASQTEEEHGSELARRRTLAYDLRDIAVQILDLYGYSTKRIWEVQSRAGETAKQETVAA